MIPCCCAFTSFNTFDPYFIPDFFCSLFLVDIDHQFIVFVSDEKSDQNKNKQMISFQATAAAAASKMATSFRFDLFPLIGWLFL